MADIDVSNIQDAINDLAQKLGMTSAQSASVIAGFGQLANSSRGAANASTAQASAVASSTNRLMLFQNALSSMGSAISATIKSFVRVPYDIADASDAYAGAGSAIQRYGEVLDHVGNALQTTGSALLITLPGLNVAFNTLSSVVGGAIDISKEQLSNQMLQMNRMTATMQNLSAVGVTFGLDFQAARIAAAQAGLSLDTFGKILVQNAEDLSTLGGGAILAGMNIGKTVNNFEDGVVAMLGGFEKANEAVTEYMAAQQQLGINAYIDQQKLLANSQTYLMQQKELQYITGKSIKQQNDELKRRAQQAAFQQVYAQMTIDERANFNAVFQQLTPQMQAAYTDMVLAAKTGNTAISETTLALGAMAPELIQTLQGLSNLEGAPEDFLVKSGEAMKSIVTQAKDAGKGYQDVFYMMQARPELFSNAGVLKIFESTVAEVGQSSGRLSGSVVAIDEAINQVKTAFMDIAGYGKIFVDLQRGLESMKNTVEGITVELFRPTAELIKFTYTVAQAQAELLKTALSEIVDLLPASVGPTPIDKQPVPLVPPGRLPEPTTPPVVQPPRPPAAQPPEPANTNDPRSGAQAPLETRPVAQAQPQTQDLRPLIVAINDLHDEDRRQTDLLNKIHNALV